MSVSSGTLYCFDICIHPFHHDVSCEKNCITPLSDFFFISLQKSAESGLLKVYERLSITFSQLYMYMDPGPPETPGSLVS